MRNAHIGVLTLAAAVKLFAVPTTIDTVIVPSPIIRYEGTMGSALVYSGMVTYKLSVGDNDSLDAALVIVPETGDPIIPTEISGDAGNLDWASGQKTIFFRFQIAGTPAASYRAKITVNANPSTRETRVNALLAQMTQVEKCAQMHGDGNYSAVGLSRLNIPGLLTTDGPYGVRWDRSTDFPASCAQANTFDTALIHAIGVAMGKETRAHNRFVLLNCMINMVRDPREGRNGELYGEDPYESAKLAVAVVQGVQSVKTVSVPKVLVCNDREENRMTYSSDIGERTLREIYCMPHEYAIKEGKAWGIMGCYNKVNGIYGSEYKHTQIDILRNDWGFKGFCISDYGAVHDAVAAANNGTDVAMDGGTPYETGLSSAVSAGLVPMAVLNEHVKRILRAEVWAGVLDAPVLQFAASLNSAEHQALALKAGRESIILAKNEGAILPLPKTSKVALLGPYANIFRAGIGGSSAVTPYYGVTPQDGIIKIIGAGNVTTSMSNADAVIVFVGPSGETEGSDRPTCVLPADQNSLVQQALGSGKKTIVVYTGGCASAAGTWSTAPAILIAMYPGQEQGNAIADVIFGNYNPGGKLSCTFPYAETQLPPWGNVPVNGHIVYEGPEEGRGYRYFDKKGLIPLFSFGHGLSYTTFKYENIRVSPAGTLYVGDRISVSVDITNTGALAGDEVLQLYVSDKANVAANKRPVRELRGFARLTLNPGEKKTVTMVLNEREFACFNEVKNKFAVDPGDFDLQVGQSSRAILLTKTITLNAVP